MLTERASKLILGAEALIVAVPLTMWLTETRLYRGAGNPLATLALLAAGAGLLSFWWLAITFLRRGAVGLRKTSGLIWASAGLCACASIAAAALLWLGFDAELQQRTAILAFGIPLLIPLAHLLIERQTRVPGAIRMPLDLDNIESVREILTGIRFVERYVDLSRRFAHPVEQRLENLQKDAVGKIVMRLGYPVEYHKGNDFFQVVLRAPPFRIHLNIVLKHGTVELIFGVYKNDAVIWPLSGPWGLIARDANLFQESIRLPVVRNYEDLTHILREALSMMEDLAARLSGRRIDAKDGRQGASRTIIDEDLTRLLSEKIERLLLEFDQRKLDASGFLRTVLRDLDDPVTAADAVDRLRCCYSLTQHLTLSSAETQLLEEIISLCSDAPGTKSNEAEPEWVAELLDEEQKFWSFTYPRFSREQRVAHWSGVLMRGMRWQVESGLDAYAVYSPEWRRNVLGVEPDIDAIMDTVFTRHWKDLWSREEYLRRIDAPSEPRQ